MSSPQERTGTIKDIEYQVYTAAQQYKAFLNFLFVISKFTIEERYFHSDFSRTNLPRCTVFTVAWELMIP